MGPLVPGPRTEITSVGFCISIEGGAFGTLVHLEHQGLPGIPSWASGSGGCGALGGRLLPSRGSERHPVLQ